MTKRRLVWVGVATGLAVAIGVLAVWESAPSRVTVENYYKLKSGMTLEEVERIFGTAGTPYQGDGFAEADDLVWGRGGMVWKGRDIEYKAVVTTRVVFGDDGKMIATSLHVSPDTPFLDRLRAWLGW